MNLNKKSKVKNKFIGVLFFFIAASAFAQTSNLSVEKVACKNNFKGSKLVLVSKNDTTIRQSFAYSYDLDNFLSLSDSLKLILVEALLKYEFDSARCCLDVTSYSFNGIEGCRGKPKNARHYTIQVDALFMINRLCWPKLMELYSCSPVLYDSRLKKEINNNQKKIKNVFAAYKKWFVKCKEKGKIDKYFPFNDGRYVWFGGRRSITSQN